MSAPFERLTPAPPDTISVVVAAYNAADTLGSTLASILDQTYPHLEVLVVDDGSTDDTAALIARAAAHDPRVVPVSYGGNRGRSAARNEGILRATGRWVAVVDADDLLARDRFERFVAAAATEPGCRLVFDDRWGFTVDGQGHVAMQHRFPGRHTWRLGGAHRVDRARHFSDRFGHMDLMADLAFVREAGATFPEDLAIGEDLAFYLTLLFATPDPRAVRVAAGSYYYRLGPTARSSGAADTWQRVIDLAVERTGSTELRRLGDRWQPIHSALFQRSDDSLASEGRLDGTSRSVDPRVRPNRWLGLAWLVSVKALQWLGRWEDRRTGATARATADVQAQLARTV